MMKDYADTLDRNPFNRCSAHNHHSWLKVELQHRLQGVRDNLRQRMTTLLAGVAIGAVFLGSIYLFFHQLAEYGW